MNAMDRIGASAIKRTKFVTAVSEIARNALIYGGGGVMTFHLHKLAGRPSVLAECVDHGPGIADVDRALQDGYTTGKGLGLGLSGARRLVDRFAIETLPGEGTTVIMECGAR